MKMPSIAMFSTSKGGVLRTVGAGVGFSHGQRRWSQEHAFFLSELIDSERFNKNATARGKVFFAEIPILRSKTAAVECFQCAQGRAESCYCGNSTAAAAAMISLERGTAEISFELRCGAKRHKASATCREAETGIRVTQTWTVDTPRILRSFKIGGRKFLRADYLNDYGVLFTQNPVRPNRFISLVKAHPKITRKLVIIETHSVPPVVRFFNCNGKHGASPLTGLATLALIAQFFPEISEALACGGVLTPKGFERLPRVESSGTSAQIYFGEVDVTFRHIKIG